MSQSIIADRRTISSKVDLRETSFVLHRDMPGRRALTSFVFEWQCRKTPSGHVLALMYVCPDDLGDDVPEQFCSATKEWERYVSTEGELLDRGYSFDDLRYQALRASLGYHDDPQRPTDEGSFTSIE